MLYCCSYSSCILGAERSNRMMFRRFPLVLVTAICTILSAFVFTSCPISIPDPWPTDFDDLFSFTQTDPEDDVELIVLTVPSSVTYDPIDVTELSLGMVLDNEQVPEDDYLYMKVESVEVRPTDPVLIANLPAPSWPAGAESIVGHEHHLGFDVDNNPGTGDIMGNSMGNDVIFDMSFVYGSTNIVDGSYLLPPPGNYQGDLSGELCEWCGSGRNYFVVRYDISDLKEYIGSGTSVTVNYYSSIVCTDSGGNELGEDYYAYDETTPASWVVPW